MWYLLVDLKSEYHTETRILFGEELQDAAAQLIGICDEAMQFDISEMCMDDIDDYYTEGYENYEALEEVSSAEELSAFWFRCNDVMIRVFAVADSYEVLQEVFAAYTKTNRKLKGWKLVSAVTEDAGTLKRMDAELQTLGADEDAKLEFFAFEE